MFCTASALVGQTSLALTRASALGGSMAARRRRFSMNSFEGMAAWRMGKKWAEIGGRDQGRAEGATLLSVSSAGSRPGELARRRMVPPWPARGRTMARARPL